MATLPQKGLKTCTSCESLLAISAFNRAKNSRDGRAPVCRRCTSANRQSTRPARGKNPIRAAIKVGDVKKLRALLSGTRFAPNQLLAMAAQNYSTARKHDGHAAIVDFLIGKGARPDREMLFEAARDGSQLIVDRLLAGGPVLDIFAGAAIGDLALVTKLIERDRRLARAKTTRESKRYGDFTPLHCCCFSGLGIRSPSKADQLLEVGKRLVGGGAAVNAKGEFYGPLVVTPLDMLAHTGGNLSLCRFLIGKGAKISGFAFAEALSHRGRTFAEGIALAELFLEMGFEMNANSWKEDGTALHGAANAGGATTVKWLLAHGADVNARGRMGRTPLHLAAERNTSSKTVEILLASGADINATDDEGLTALDVAQQLRKTAVARCLRSALAKLARA